MTKNKGLWVAVGGTPLSDAVSDSIFRHEQFTMPVTTFEVRPRLAEVVVVSMHGMAADYVGISQASRKITTGQVAIAISHLVDLRRLPCDEIRHHLPGRFVDGFVPPSSGVWRPTPRLWEEILKVVATTRLDVVAKIKDLRHIVAGAGISRGRVDGGLEVFERDAIASILQTWGGSSFRKRILRRAAPSRSTPVAPFLSRLGEVSIREDLHIEHDHTTFPGMEVARRDAVGSVVLASEDEYLTILNCNRQPLERTLGVDLIYYNHRFDAFILVQYKRMTSVSGGPPEYRPGSDGSYEREMERIAAAEKLLREQSIVDADLTQFRLCADPFYLKLCESKAVTFLDSGMVSGMYVPVGLWSRIVTSSTVRGPRGGVSITWDSCTRRLNNGEFTNLLRQGWIGSASGQSRVLSQLIEGVLANGRMLVLGATSAGRPSADLRRDSLGRFAAKDDPSGSL